MSKLFSCIILTTFLNSSFAQQNNVYSATTEDTIKMVENGLGGPLQIQDSVNTWSIEQRMKRKGINGVSVAVIRNYEIAWAKGYGVADKETNKPVTPQTLFQAASISKSLNGVGILKLVEDKKIDLYEDINIYLKSWQFPYDTVSHGKKISVANLLSHTAGLTVHGFAGYQPGDSIPTIDEILDGKRPSNSQPVRSMFEPGFRSEYSGGGITVSQLILTDVTGEKYAKYMQENVLDPLGMKMSSYQQPPAKNKERFLATGYYGNGKAINGKYHIYPEEAAAGLWTNPTDLSKYIIETQLSLEGKSDKVLNTDMTKLRLTPYIDGNAALGVFITEKGGVKYFSHGGANEGFRSHYYGSFDGGNGVVVMVNSDNGSIMNEIVNSVASVYKWKDFFTPTARKVIAITTNMLNAYSGKYLLDKDTITISSDNGRTILHVSNGEFFRVYFSSEQNFFSPELPFDLKFEKDNSGKVTDIYFKNGGGEHRAMRIE